MNFLSEIFKKDRIKDQIIQFDSCTSLMNALARYLEGKDFPMVGLSDDDPPSWIADAMNLVPQDLRIKLYSWSGWLDAIPAKEMSELRSEDIDQWVTSVFPERKYPGIMFGSANGGAIHIAAALGMPWLPQTFLLASRRFISPDDMHGDIEWGKEAIAPFLEANPDMQTTQMHDPIQDRLMIQKMGYFRIKKCLLGQAYRDFIINNREKDAPFISVECRYAWPALEINDRHLFQVGGLGAVDPYEYLQGSKRVKQFLKKVGSDVDHWETFEPSGEYPEGEWGFAEAVLDDIAQFTSEHGIDHVRLIFDHPEQTADFTAALYEWWYQQRGRQSQSLLVENFGLLAPHDVVESTSIPFWLAFNTDDSFEKLKKYLNSHEKFKEIFLMLMSNGVAEGIGLTPIEQWKKLLAKACHRGEFIGVDEREYSLDFGTFIRYNKDLKEKLDHRQPLPEPLMWQELQEFVQTHGSKFNVSWRFSSEKDTKKQGK